MFSASTGVHFSCELQGFQWTNEHNNIFPKNLQTKIHRKCPLTSPQIRRKNLIKEYNPRINHKILQELPKKVKEMHPTKNPQKIAVLNEHQISFEHDDTGLSISVCNMGTMDRYALRNVKLININGKGFEAALFGTNKDFSVKVEEGVRDVEGVQEKILEIRICYKPAFLVKVEEKLVLPWKNKLNELLFYQSKAQRIQQNLREIAQKNSSRSKIARVVESKQFKSNINNNGQYYDQGQGDANYDILPFESINLPQPSRYNIEISFLLNCTATYFYFYHDNVAYSSIFPAAAMMVPVNNQYIPVKLSYIFDNRTVNVKTHTFYAYDIVDYPFRVRNLVITATKMMD